VLKGIPLHKNIFHLILKPEPTSRSIHVLLATSFGSKESHHQAITKIVSWTPHTLQVGDLPLYISKYTANIYNI
jgi:hypothetical protein